jgi:hypothetical protein
LAGYIADEIESMGKSEKRELASRLTVLLLHLLKWRFQPGLPGKSWRAAIRIQRRDLTVHLADNPSLVGVLPVGFRANDGRGLLAGVIPCPRSPHLPIRRVPR